MSSGTRFTARCSTGGCIPLAEWSFTAPWRRVWNVCTHPLIRKWRPNSLCIVKKAVTTSALFDISSSRARTRHSVMLTGNPLQCWNTRVISCPGSRAIADRNSIWRSSKESAIRITRWATWSGRLQCTIAMATRAAEAGVLAAQANAMICLPHTAESIPFFLRAIELDPKLVRRTPPCRGYTATLARRTVRRNTRSWPTSCGGTSAIVSACPSLISTMIRVTGDQLRATETLEEWKRAYPTEFQPVNGLTLIHNFLGDFKRAIEEGHEAVKRNPFHGYPYSNLAHAYRGIGRFDDARKTAERAVALDIETLPIRRLLYQLAVLAGDEEAAGRHLDWCRDKPREYDMIGARAQAAGYFGKVREARQLYEDTALMAERRNLADAGNGHLAWATWMEVAYGNMSTALQEARRVLSHSPSYDPRLRAALTLALTGYPGDAQAIAGESSSSNPEHTIVNSVLVPIVRAGIELSHSRPARAIEELRIVAPYELGFVAVLAPIYLRAQSYLMQGSSLQAAAEFQRLLDHRGSDPFSPFYAVAPVGMARALAMAGDVAGSLLAYEQFFRGWAGADPDVPVLLEARKEYDLIKHGGGRKGKLPRTKTARRLAS